MKKGFFLFLCLAIQGIMFSENISEIQGITHNSPYLGKKVTDVEGVVTAVYNSKYNKGFFMQSIERDNDDRTSEGIWVSGYLDVKKGNLVKVDGVVDEVQFGSFDSNNLTTTTIKSDKVEILGENINVTPIAIKAKDIPKKVSDFSSDTLDIHKNSSDFYESLESMLVEVENPVISGMKESHGEISILPDGGEEVENVTNNGGVLYSYDNEQTHRIIIGDELVSLREKGKFKDPNFTPNPGDKFDGNIVGVMAYSFGNYKLFNIDQLPNLLDSGAKVDKPKYKYDKNKLNVVSYNIENFNNLQKGRANELARQIMTVLQKPDIIGLIEVQDDDGDKKSSITSAEKNLKAIVKAIKDMGGPEYLYIDGQPLNNVDGGAPGGNIRNAILYRKDRVQLKNQRKGKTYNDTKVSDEKELSLTINPGRIGNEADEFKATRKPVVAHFDFQGKDVIVIVNHLSSKRGDMPIYSSSKTIRKSEKNRIKQAEFINSFVKDILAKNDNATVISMGDMNDFEFSPTISAMEGNELFTVIKDLPLRERHTYVHQGNSQVLDHILINNKYKGNVNVDVLNINSEFTKAQGSFSDHDPVFIQFEVK